MWSNPLCWSQIDQEPLVLGGQVASGVNSQTLAQAQAQNQALPYAFLAGGNFSYPWSNLRLMTTLPSAVPGTELTQPRTLPGSDPNSSPDPILTPNALPTTGGPVYGVDGPLLAPMAFPKLEASLSSIPTEDPGVFANFAQAWLHEIASVRSSLSNWFATQFHFDFI